MILSKIQHGFEIIILGMAIHWQPIFGIAASICGGLYYISMLKMNVIDKKHGGSWKKYFKSFVKK